MEFVDAACPNLWVRVGKRRKSFSVLIGSSANRRRIAIGQYPTISLVEARKLAAELLGDPRAAGGGRPRRGGKQRRGTTNELFEFVISSMEVEGKTASIRDYRYYLIEGRDSALNDFGSATPACNVSSDMVTDWLSKFHERGSSTRLPRAILSAAFNRGIKADNDPTTVKDSKILFAIDRNPVANVGGPTQSNTRDRSLSFEEIRQFWNALESGFIADPARSALQLVISMGGVRITEIIRSELSWWQWDGAWRTIDAPRLQLPKTKNGHPHDLPVTRHAEIILRNLISDDCCSTDFLFPGPLKPGKPIAIEVLSRAVSTYCMQSGQLAFTPRDLRRTVKNQLLDRDVPQNEVDIWHNHGRNADVARRNYDRAQYEYAKARVRDETDKLIDEF